MSAAIISGCGQYRYTLDREFGSAAPVLLWVMLNPSKADAEKDDPTIRKCIGFTGRLGYERLRVVNLFAWRATNPNDLADPVDPVGPENERHLARSITYADRVIVAWGAHQIPGFRQQKIGQVARVLEIMGHRRLECLGTSKDGSPRHPLMLPYATQLKRWEVPSV